MQSLSHNQNACGRFETDRLLGVAIITIIVIVIIIVRSLARSMSLCAWHNDSSLSRLIVGHCRSLDWFSSISFSLFLVQVFETNE